MTVFIVLLSLLILDVAGVVCLTIKAERLVAELERPHGRSKRKKMDYIGRTENFSSSVQEEQGGKMPHSSSVCGIGVVHNQGARPSQQDSLCVESVFGGSGVLAVVADGMGGLSGGEKVSGRIVQDVRAVASQLKAETMDSTLVPLVENISSDINQLLGTEGIYKSGSTVLIVLADQNRFSWISVGDSRIYLYRDGVMNKVNVEHNLLTTEWMQEIRAGRMDLQSAVRNPEGKKLTSFIGMGKLRYIDYSRSAVRIMPGDRIVLMTDGVFSAVPDRQMAQILGQCPDVAQAASLLENQVLAAKIRGQDNFTAVILGF